MGMGNFILLKEDMKWNFSATEINKNIKQPSFWKTKRLRRKVNMFISYDSENLWAQNIKNVNKAYLERKITME